jgi:hypothetical protein
MLSRLLRFCSARSPPGQDGGQGMTFLVRRFGPKAEDLKSELIAISDEARLSEPVGHAATCRSLASFRKKRTS